MTGPWKPWKTKQRFPTAPTAPWKSPVGRFPHSHCADAGVMTSKRQQALPSRPADARAKKKKKTTERRPSTASSCAGARPKFQAHSALERSPAFRLIARWNQNALSGSFVDWKMLGERGKGAGGSTGVAAVADTGWRSESSLRRRRRFRPLSRKRRRGLRGAALRPPGPDLRDWLAWIPTPSVVLTA
jgi:hypothetical protein